MLVFPMILELFACPSSDLCQWSPAGLFVPSLICQLKIDWLWLLETNQTKTMFPNPGTRVLGELLCEVFPEAL